MSDDKLIIIDEYCRIFHSHEEPTLTGRTWINVYECDCCKEKFV